MRGALAKETGVNIETIRYYEKIGLLPNPRRTEAGYRIYAATDLKRLMFIRRSRELGFSLDELSGLLGLIDSGDYICAEVRDLTIAHLGDVQQKIRDLRKMEAAIEEMIFHCKDDSVPKCPIVDTLFSAGGEYSSK